MKKSKIEWCDMTWNPVTGCLHGCEYCYARGIANRFGSIDDDTPIEDIINGLRISLDYEHGEEYIVHDESVELITPIYNFETKAPYPFNFRPTFHRYRLAEPTKLKKPQNVFVCSMADLFGEWVPDGWIRAVFEACEAAPQHRYMFLTKNPGRLPLSSYVYSGKFDKHSNNFWFGKTITDQKSLEKDFKHFTNINGNTFLSIEPLLGPVDLSRIDVGDVIYNTTTGRASYLFGMQKVKMPRWVIIGAMTGPGAKKHQPRREWIDNIVAQCRAANVPVFMKNSLVPVMGEKNMIREFPWEGE